MWFVYPIMKLYLRYLNQGTIMRRRSLRSETQYTMRLLIVVFAVISSSVAFRTPPQKAIGCTADANANYFPEPDPLFLYPGKVNQGPEDYEEAFILPLQDTGMLTFQENEEVRIACPGSTISAAGTEEAIVSCLTNNDWQLENGKKIRIGELACKSVATNKAIRKDTCVNGATGIELGFEVGGDFFPLVYTCFDEETLVTHYSQERVPAELSGYESGESSPSFSQDDFYPDLNVNTLYTYDNQMDIFTQVLGSSSLAQRYLADRNNYFLARGHFAPRADFVLGAHTRATYHFVNVAGQWQIFNGGVWENLESSVRNYAVNSGTDLIAWTGPWGTLTYPDINGQPKEIYLSKPGTSQQALRVPKFYWKIVQDPATKRGVAFIGINDPYVDSPRPSDYILCNNIIQSITWLQVSDPLDLLYACEVTEFLQVSDTLPAPDVSGGVLDS